MPYPIITVRFLNAQGMAIFPFILIKHKGLLQDQVLIQHETIHLRQQLELLVLPFYLLYLANYLINLCRYRQHDRAYMNIIFEREAYAHEMTDGYLKRRKFCAWVRYLGR